MLQYRTLQENEINRDLFQYFIRRQVVTKCWRRQNGEWVIREDPFLDDWTDKDYEELIPSLKNTVLSGGLVYAAFYNGQLKGFVSVEPQLSDNEHKYLDLSNIHISEDMRHKGIGTALFLTAKEWAKDHGAKKLYISAHSAVESQAFYKKMGCVEAALYNQEHVEKEPFDCQLECSI